MVTPYARLYHPHDPLKPKLVYDWPFVYLHGKAQEELSQSEEAGGWQPHAHDIFLADKSMPALVGELHVLVYGKLAIAVFSKRHLDGCLSGRVALVDDLDGLTHARHVAQWR